MNNDEEKIESLKKRLYSLSNEPGHSGRPKLHKHQSDVHETWEDEAGDELLDGSGQKKQNSGVAASATGTKEDSYKPLETSTGYFDPATARSQSIPSSPVRPPLNTAGGEFNASDSTLAPASAAISAQAAIDRDQVISQKNKADSSKTKVGDIIKQNKQNVRNAGGKKGSLLGRIFIVCVIAMIAAIGFFVYVNTTGSNNISANNIDINVIGPVAVPAGEVLTLDIDVTNRNPSAIQGVDLVVRYPEGTRQAEDGSTTILSDRLSLGDIPQGQTARRRINVILFGEENVKKDIKLTIQYHIPGSIILFNKEKTYPLFIGSAPISIDVASLKEVTPNQTTTFKATITSNSQNVIKNLVLQAAYPSGFRFEKSIPEASFGNSTWTIGDLKPGDKREIEISGQILGQAEVEQYFTFTAGTEDPLDHSRIASKLVESKERIQVKKPFLAADLALNKVGDAIFVGVAGDDIRADITYQNNLSVPLYDVVIIARLAGATLDKESVSGERGFYNSSANAITWEGATVSELQELQPGVSGNLQFSFASLPASLKNNSNFRRQTMTVNLEVKAKRLSESQVPEEIKSTVSRTIRIASELALSSRLVRNVGPFENTGPMPPVAERPSTFTVMNSISNSFNTVKNVTYTTTLPSYVRWLGKVYPDNAMANIKYNEDRREITWTLGDIAPGTGYNTSAREFGYQVEFLPSVSQVGESPVIVGASRIAGTDAFTETVVEYAFPVLTTKIETDPQFQFGQDKVLR